MYISHKGIGTGRGIPFSLPDTLKVAPGQQATFAHCNKFAKRTAVQGQCDLAGAGDIIAGIIVDCSSKGDSVTVETAGFETVRMASLTGINSGSLVTSGADGLAVAIAGAAPTLAELTAGVFEVDQLDSANTAVLIDLDKRL